MPLTRRDFLATATAASQSRILGANDRVRLGIIGTGGRGSYLMGVANKVGGIEWVAVCDAWDVRRGKAAEAHRPRRRRATPIIANCSTAKTSTP